MHWLEWYLLAPDAAAEACIINCRQHGGTLWCLQRPHATPCPCGSRRGREGPAKPRANDITYSSFSNSFNGSRAWKALECLAVRCTRQDSDSDSGFNVHGCLLRARCDVLLQQEAGQQRKSAPLARLLPPRRGRCHAWRRAGARVDTFGLCCNEAPSSAGLCGSLSGADTFSCEAYCMRLSRARYCAACQELVRSSYQGAESR